MTDTGWIIAGAGVAISGAQSNPWSNPNNVTTESDATYASCNAIATGESHTLRVSSFGFAIPSGADILGVEARFRASRANSNQVNFNHIRMVIADVDVGDNKASSNAIASGFADYTFGGASDLWGLSSISPADINTAAFGIDLRLQMNKSAEARVSSIWMRIYFQAGVGVFVRDSGVWKEGDAFVNDGGIWKSAAKFVNDGGVWKS